MKLSEQLFNSSIETWKKYLSHPFVVEMAKGTLDVSRFRTYMLQDYIYLKEYIKLFAVGILKTNDWELIQFFNANTTALLEETFRVHVPFMKELGITEEAIRNELPHKNNSDYSTFLLKEAFSGDVLTVLTLLLNCSWGYAYIAKEMVARYPDCVDHPLYGSWFLGYACEEYQNTNQELIDMVDQLSTNISADEAAKLCCLFSKCGEYELGFWSIA